MRAKHAKKNYEKKNSEKCNSVTVTFKIHFEKCNRLQLHEVTFQKNVTGYGYMKLLFKKCNRLQLH